MSSMAICPPLVTKHASSYGHIVISNILTSFIGRITWKRLQFKYYWEVSVDKITSLGIFNIWFVLLVFFI